MDPRIGPRRWPGNLRRTEVVFVSKHNEGAAATRNHAFKLSQGDYIQWLDADDLLAPDKIERQLAALREGDSKRTLLSSSWGHFQVSNRTCALRPYLPLAGPYTSRVACDERWVITSTCKPATWLTSRELAEAAGPWDTRLHVDDDGEYFCRVLLSSKGTRFVPEARVYYREHCVKPSKSCRCV